MKHFAVHVKVDAVSPNHACKIVENMIKEKGCIDEVFAANEIPKSVPTINILYIERGLVQFLVAFRHSLDGNGMAESCFEYLAGKLDMLNQDSDDETMMQEIADGLEMGTFINGDKMLFLVESTPVEDVEPLAEAMDSIEEIQDDYSGMVDN
jgi:hypothetical protein